MPENLIYFCDESHIRGSDWFGVGGLAIPTSNIHFVEGAIFGIRAAFGYSSIASEVQWKSAKIRRDNIYKAYVDLLHSLVERKIVHLHLRFTPAQGRSTKPADISKAFYSLLLHRAGRHFHKDYNILIRPDNGCCTEYLPSMKTGLNNDIARKFGGKPSTVRDIAPQNSRTAHALQLLDVTLGAVCAARNNNHRNGALSEFKASLANYTLDKFSIHSSIPDTPINQKHLNIWNVRPR